MDKTALYKFFGLTYGKDTFPYLNARIADATFDPWKDPAETAKMMADESATEKFELLWHQVCGVIRMTDNLFEGLPLLLADGMGLGKTIQIIAFICWVAFMRVAHEQYGDYPGRWCECPVRTT
jgi:hypothetical protein